MILFCSNYEAGSFSLTAWNFDVIKYELDHAGEDITYTIVEDEIPGYEITVTTEENDLNGKDYGDDPNADSKSRVFNIYNKFDNSDKFCKGHALSLDGDIGVIFYYNIPEDMLSSASVNFKWFDKEINSTEFKKDAGTGYYKVSCPVAVAEMTYDVTATLTVGDVEEKNVYSAQKYANVIIGDMDYRDRLIGSLAETMGEEKAKEKYDQLVMLVCSMLDYGSDAQKCFDCNTDNLANMGCNLCNEEVTSSMIESHSDNMTSDIEKYGLEYQYTAVVFLSKTSLRHYYKITDADKFAQVAGGITFDGVSVSPVERGDLVFFEKQSIAAGKLDYQYELKIGESVYRYSVMDYIKRLMDSDNGEDYTELSKATYRFSQAANAYFES